LCHFGEAAIYTHCFEKIGLKGLKTEFQQFHPIFLILIFLKNNAADIIPVLLTQVAYVLGLKKQSKLFINALLKSDFRYAALRKMFGTNNLLRNLKQPAAE
jgi:hypothetical protein